MKEILGILRQELVLCMRLSELTEQQRTALAKTLDSQEAAAAVQQMEPLLKQLGKAEKQKALLLAQAGESTMADFLQKQPPSPEKQLFEQLLEKLAHVSQKLQRAGAGNDVLLQRNLQYIAFNIKVMAQAQADATYASSGGDETNTLQTKKMFDRSV